MNFGDGVERDSGTITVTNCAIFNNADDIDAAASVTDANNATDDNEGANPQDLNENGAGEWTAAFTDYTTYDFTVKDTDSLLYNNGTADPGSGLYSDDIIGTSRPQSTSWDIGAFELIVGAPPAGGITVLSAAIQSARRRIVGNGGGSDWIFGRTILDWFKEKLWRSQCASIHQVI